MTLIIAYASDKTVYMGCDNYWSNGWTYNSKLSEKIFTVNDEFLVGYAGDGRGGQILKHHVTFPDPAFPISNRNEFERYLTIQLIPILHDAFKQNNYLSENQVKCADDNFRIIIAHRTGNICVIYDDFFAQMASPSTRFEAIGGGGVVAESIMTTLEELEFDEDYRVEMALNIAYKVSPNVRGPFDIFSLDIIDEQKN